MEDNGLNDRIGLRMLKLRERQGLTTTVLAGMVGVSQAQISRLENGKQGFRTSTLSRIAKALSVKPASLLDDYDDDVIEKAMEDPRFREAVKEAAAIFIKGGPTVIVTPSAR